jgi:Flp pilus assembly protein TadG
VRALHVPERGQALVELAIILPVLLLFLLGAIDLGRVWHSQITVENAAREGAMEAAMAPTSYHAGQPCDGPEDEATDSTGNRVMCRILNEVSGTLINVVPADVSVACSAACVAGTTSSPNRVTVEVTGHFSLLTPFMAVFTGGQNITLTGSAVATIAMAPTNAGVASATPTPALTPTPTPSPTPSSNPSVTPTPTPSFLPTPTPTPSCTAPVANFSVNPTSGKKKKTTFVFTDSSTNMNVPGCNPIWSWNFGDGSGTSSLKNPSYQYQTSGSYTVTLAASNAGGTSTKTLVINVSN